MTNHDQGRAGAGFLRSVAIITVSDRGAKGEREDASGRALSQFFSKSGFDVMHRAVVPDEIEDICAAIVECADKKGAALIVTTGGTGVSPRDVTPDATLRVTDRVVPGMAEAMRAAGLRITPHAMISRAVVAVRGRSLVVNLPGSPKGALENIEVILPALPHALDKIQGDPSECGSGALQK